MKLNESVVYQRWLNSFGFMFLFERYHLLAAEWVDSASFWSLSKSLEEDLAFCCILKTIWKGERLWGWFRDGLGGRDACHLFLFSSQMAGYRKPLWQWTLEFTKSKCDKGVYKFIDCILSLYKQWIKIFQNSCVLEEVLHIDSACCECCYLFWGVPDIM